VSKSVGTDQFENGYTEGHFTIEVFYDGMGYSSHQVIGEDRSDTTIIRAGKYNSSKKAVHESIIKLEDAEAAQTLQKNMINEQLGEYDAIENSCVSHVIDIINAGNSTQISKSKLGYARFMRKNGFAQLPSDKSVLGG